MTKKKIYLINSENRSLLKRKAFSMIELSIVILIIGILVGGVLVSQKLIEKFRINTAQTLTISSPVNGIPDSTLWLETSLDKSFKDSESSDKNPLSAWYDIRENVNKNNAIQLNSANTPTYSNTINYIHAVKFDGTNGYFTISDASFLNNSDYTIFVLEKRESNKSSNYFIGDSSSPNESTSNKNLTLGYSADGTIKHSQSNDNSYTSSITTYAESNGNPRIFTFVHDKTSGKKTYINGLLAATSSNTDNLTGITSLKIGSGYQGQIGEIIMFSRAITKEERQSVEDYLGKKWTSPILRTVGGSSLEASCTGGIISTTGCKLTCTVPTTTGITVTSVSDGSTILNCSAENHFTGTISYSCSNGVFSAISGSCTCSTGYQASGSSCISQKCIFSGVTGIANGTQVDYTTSPVTRNCDSNSTGTITYTCAGGDAAPTVISGSCTPVTQCSGGVTDYTSIPGEVIHTFKSSGTLTCTASVTAKVLVVGGGGSGGTDNGQGGGGGGGAGGVVYATSYALSSQQYPVVVGAGGAAVTTNSTPGNKGNDSVFDILTASGGGGGQSGSTGNYSGGSGGGGNWVKTGASSTQASYSGATSYGNAGGSGTSVPYVAGGGGGAGGAGGNGTSTSGGNGGAGIAINITGTSTYYAGGGGGSAGAAGGSYVRPGGTGGSGIGGSGDGNNSSSGKSATANTGSGGGGSAGSSTAGAGGSGIVIVRYAL